MTGKKTLKKNNDNFDKHCRFKFVKWKLIMFSSLLGYPDNIMDPLGFEENP